MMLKHVFAAFVISCGLFLYLSPMAHAGFEWLPDGQTPYSDTATPKPAMSLPASNGGAVTGRAPQGAGRGVSPISGNGIFLPLPGQGQQATTVNPTPRTSSPVITPPTSMPNPSPQVQRYTPDFKTSMPNMRNSVGAPQSGMMMRDNGAGAARNSVAGGSSFKLAEGFGSEIPLAMALRQVVPADYAFSFGNGVNPGYRISWNGGKPWNEVVFDLSLIHI